MLTKAAFIWSDKSKKRKTVKYYYSIIPVMQSWIFSSQSSVSHDPSEIILMRTFLFFYDNIALLNFFFKLKSSSL